MQSRPEIAEVCRRTGRVSRERDATVSEIANCASAQALQSHRKTRELRNMAKPARTAICERVAPARVRLFGAVLIAVVVAAGVLGADARALSSR